MADGMWQQIVEVEKIDDDTRRAWAAGELITTHQTAVLELSRIRKESVLNLHASGLSHKQIAARLGTSRNRISRITRRGPLSERAFLGTGKLIVAVRRKSGEGTDRLAVAAETQRAYDRLAELADRHEITSEMWPFPPPGLVDLNLVNLIVMGGPRLFPLVGQILKSDQHLRFDTDDDGRWFLRDLDTGRVFRSPRDSGENRDFAYIGRLPRPDGTGTFLCLAGIHAIGTQGAVAYLESSLAKLWTETGTGRFSLLVECVYDRETLLVTAAGAASPIYRHQR